MVITVNGTPIKVSADYEEYLELMCKAVVKPGEDPVPNTTLMLESILRDNYTSNIKQHAAVRPRRVAEKIKAIEAQAMAVIEESANEVIG